MSPRRQVRTTETGVELQVPSTLPWAERLHVQQEMLWTGAGVNRQEVATSAAFPASNPSWIDNKVSGVLGMELVPRSPGQVQRHWGQVSPSPGPRFYAQLWFRLPCHLLVGFTVFLFPCLLIGSKAGKATSVDFGASTQTLAKLLDQLSSTVWNLFGAHWTVQAGLHWGQFNGVSSKRRATLGFCLFVVLRVASQWL